MQVVKVGGSLYDLPDLGPRLRFWLAREADAETLIVPGGGPTADAVRAFDASHGLGAEAAHWLALRALTLNAHFLAALLPSARVVGGVGEARGLLLLDAHAFCRADEGRPGALPPSWDATSDAVAARAALVFGADRLTLLKSTEMAETMDWEAAARRGIVDALFPALVRQRQGLAVRVLNLRGEGWRAGSVSDRS